MKLYSLFFSRKTDKKPPKKISKKDVLKRLQGSDAVAICYAPALLANPSQFAVYSTVRRTILSRCRQLQAASQDLSDDSDCEDSLPLVPAHKVPKVLIIHLSSSFYCLHIHLNTN